MGPIEKELFDIAKPMLERHEGRCPVAYKDTVGIWTVGVGHNLQTPISDDVIDVILADDLRNVETALDCNLPWWRSEGWPRQLALIDLCFNLGIRGLLQFRNTLAAWKAGDYEGAAKGLMDSKWYGQVGKRGPAVVQMVRGTWPY